MLYNETKQNVTRLLLALRQATIWHCKGEKTIEHQNTDAIKNEMYIDASAAYSLNALK